MQGAQRAHRPRPGPPAQAHPEGGCELRRGGSVPGRVRQVPGGVGRNIAEAALHLLEGAPPRHAGGAAPSGGGGSSGGTSGGIGGGDADAGPSRSSGGLPEPGNATSGGGREGTSSGGGGRTGGSDGGVLLITVLGRDPAGDALAAHCVSLGCAC